MEKKISHGTLFQWWETGNKQMRIWIIMSDSDKAMKKFNTVK